MAEEQKNLHVPLPVGWHEALRAEARRQGRSATQLAREAIGSWLDERRREEVERQLALYIATVSVSADDLDPALERAAVDELIRSEAVPRRRRRR